MDKRGLLHGILAVDKPRNLTSHDVVARVRRLSGQQRIGHAGTLDPMATGVLLLCLGEATRVSDALMAGTKWYLARVAFGVRTDTDDAQGTVIASSTIAFTSDDLRRALRAQVGMQAQMPPAYAAIKRGGVPAYRLARAGIAPDLAAREIHVHAITLLAMAQQMSGGETADLLIACSKGTYIRSIARDLGEQLGCGAHLSGLRRLASGSLTTRDCHTLPDLEQAVQIGGSDALAARLQPIDAALQLWPACVLDSDRAPRPRYGLPFDLPIACDSEIRLYDDFGQLLGLAARRDPDSMTWHAHPVFRTLEGV